MERPDDGRDGAEDCDIRQDVEGRVGVPEGAVGDAVPTGGFVPGVADGRALEYGDGNRGDCVAGNECEGCEAEEAEPGMAVAISEAVDSGCEDGSCGSLCCGGGGGWGRTGTHAAGGSRGEDA